MVSTSGALHAGGRVGCALIGPDEHAELLTYIEITRHQLDLAGITADLGTLTRAAAVGV